MDSRPRRSPPDRASAVPYGQGGENAMRFPRLAHRSAAAHKLHSTPQQDRMNLISGNVKPAAGYRPLAYSSPEPVQTPGTVALHDRLTQPITRLLCAWPIKLERPVEQKDVGCERLQFTALSVI